MVSSPTPHNGLIGNVVRAVVRQVNQPQPQTRRPRMLSDSLASVCRGIVSDNVQRLRAPLPQLGQGAAELSALLFPSCFIDSTPPGFKHTAE